MKYNYFDISGEDLSKWKYMCPPDEYRVLDRSEFSALLSPVLPTPLLNKYDSVVIAGSAAVGGIVYYMANGNRVDYKGGAIDQMPFGLGFIGEQAAGSGCLIQHGNWNGRTTYPPDEFWNYISGSAIQNYYPLSEIPSVSAGKIWDLHVNSQDAAFGEIVKVIKSQVEKQEEDDQDLK